MLQRPPGTSKALGYGDFDTTMAVLAGAVTPAPYLLGEHFSTADVLIGSALRWARWRASCPSRRHRPPTSPDWPIARPAPHLSEGPGAGLVRHGLIATVEQWGQR